MLTETELAGKLASVPFLPKDVFETAGLRTTYGSKIFSEHTPTHTAPAVQRLTDAGAVIIGKANLDEFARGVSTRNPFYGSAKNPRSECHTPGGSSGGNAAALSAGLAALGLATDAGGSIRAPAAACGVAGFKPTFGLVPTEGSFALAAPFDHAGPMGRSIDDCALAMNVLTGMSDPTPTMAGLKVGVTALFPRHTRLEDLGGRVEETTLPRSDHLLPFHLAEFAYTHRDLFRDHETSYSQECTSMLRLGFEVSAVTYRRLSEELMTWRQRCHECLLYDVLVGPTLPREPVRVDEPETFDLLREMSSLTRPFNYLGWPAATTRDGLMFAGRSDTKVLGAALAWEASLEDEPPTLWTTTSRTEA
jgi:aspartyl-tRNA(Asn)/glutamyl-tRNA(Gln) amidotransferase subunit A